MVTYAIRAGGLTVPLMVMMILWMTVPGEAHGGTLYKYTDKDGSVIITDNPPPGVKAKGYIVSDDMPTEPKAAPEIEPGVKIQPTQEAEAKKEDKQQKIKSLREELDKAIRDEAAYRRNMNQASGFSQRRHWRLLVDEQLNLIEEKKKQIEELESSRP